MQRIVIIGPCGAGKSTLAAQLGVRLGLPVFHMDQLNWQPGWVESDKETLSARIAEAIAGESWLIDGTYGGTLAMRLERADTVIYLDYPIWLCLWRLLRRIATWHGSARPDMPDGCPERFDPAFFWYVMRWNSGPKKRLEQRLHAYAGTLVRLPSPGALRMWLGRLEPSE